MTSGQEFVVLGKGFDQLPEQLVLSSRIESAQTSDIPYQRIIMASKTDTEMIFITDGSHTFQSEVEFKYLATPNAAPRTLIEYDTIDNRDLGEIRRIDNTNEAELLRESPLYD